jgi:Metallopeptidase family M24
VRRSIALAEIGAPELLVPEEQPMLSAAEYRRRVEALRSRVAADVIVVYADREHFANLAFLCGFDPRFEEALLVLAAGSQTLIAGTESLSLTTLLPVDVEVLHCPSLGLMGQDRAAGLRLADALEEAGVRPGERTAVVGWKYFEPVELGSPGTPIAAPAFAVDAIRDLVGADGAVTDATEAMMNPQDGLRTISGADQIGVFEWAAARASRAVASIVSAAEPGLTERQAVAAMPYTGEPLSAHVMFASGPEVAVGLRSATDRRLELGDAATTAVGFWGGLCCRAGLIERAPPKAGSHAADYLEQMAIPYWTAIATWYESIRLGTPGGEIDQRIRAVLEDTGFGSALNPGHLTHLDEWVHSPVRPRSGDLIRSGMCLQCDIIPDATRPGFAANCEDTLAVGDAEVRAELARQYPVLWSRIELRRAFMRERLGLEIGDEVLPLSAAPAYFAPFWLSPDHALISS